MNKQQELFPQRRYAGRLQGRVRVARVGAAALPSGFDFPPSGEASKDAAAGASSGPSAVVGTGRVVTEDKVTRPNSSLGTRRKMLADQLQDPDRRAFLDALDRAPFEVSDWEAEFIESTIEQQTFSPKQREVIDRMICKYGERIGF